MPADFGTRILCRSRSGVCAVRASKRESACAASGALSTTPAKNKAGRNGLFIPDAAENIAPVPYVNQKSPLKTTNFATKYASLRRFHVSAEERPRIRRARSEVAREAGWRANFHVTRIGSAVNEHCANRRFQRTADAAQFHETIFLHELVTGQLCPR